MRTVRQLLSGKTRAIYSVDVDDPVLEAIRLMADKRVGALPVLRNGALAGIMSERDYARKVVLLGRSSAEPPMPWTGRVKERRGYHACGLPASTKWPAGHFTV